MFPVFTNTELFASVI